MTNLEKFHALHEQADTIWAFRDALLSEKHDLYTYNFELNARNLTDEIESLAQQAEALEAEAHQIYNDPATWTQDESAELNQKISETWDTIPEIPI